MCNVLRLYNNVFVWLYIIIFNATRFVLHYRIHNHSVFITVADMEAVNYGHVVLWRHIGNWL